LRGPLQAGAIQIEKAPAEVVPKTGNHEDDLTTDDADFFFKRDKKDK
jgi:hypothetical protein